MQRIYQGRDRFAAGLQIFPKRPRWRYLTADHGIRVNTVHPGVIDTPIWTKIPASAASNAPIDPNVVGVPLGKAGQARDIANGVLFLASDDDRRGARDRRRHDG